MKCRWLIGAAFADYLRTSGTALLAHQGPPTLNAVDAGLRTYAGEIDALRREGLTRTLSGEEAERIFALGFSLEQMHHDFKDLVRTMRDRMGTTRQWRQGGYNGR